MLVETACRRIGTYRNGTQYGAGVYLYCTRAEFSIELQNMSQSPLARNVRGRALGEESGVNAAVSVFCPRPMTRESIYHGQLYESGGRPRVRAYEVGGRLLALALWKSTRTAPGGCRDRALAIANRL